MRFFRVFVCGLACLFSNNVLAAETPKKALKKKAVAIDQDVDPPQKEDLLPKRLPTAKRDEESRESLAAPNATILPETLVEFGGELPRIKKLIESALALTTRDLTYIYGSDDPANGGMDCSGFIYYVLRQCGYADVPRDASSQYVWLRKAGTFRAVLSRKPTTFELDDLRPGDLLFWIGTYATDHDPPVTHTMLYLGKEKETKSRVMVGSSDGRSYRGKSRWGVSVFDFKMPKPDPNIPEKRVTFAGYARIPGLHDDGVISAKDEPEAPDSRKLRIMDKPTPKPIKSHDTRSKKSPPSVRKSGAGDSK